MVGKISIRPGLEIDAAKLLNYCCACPNGWRRKARSSSDLDTRQCKKIRGEACWTVAGFRIHSDRRLLRDHATALSLETALSLIMGARYLRFGSVSERKRDNLNSEECR